MASKDDSPKPPKNMNMMGGKKNSIQAILNGESNSKKPQETHVQFIDKQKTTERPKVEGKLEQKRNEASKPIVGKHTLRVVKEREKDE